MLGVPVTLIQVHKSEAARHASSSNNSLNQVVPYHGYEIPRGLDAAISVSGTKIKAWLDGKPCHSTCEFAALLEAKRTELVNWLGETVHQSCSLVGKWTKASGRSAPSFIALIKAVRNDAGLVQSTPFEQAPFRHRFFEDGDISIMQVNALQDLQAVLHRAALLKYQHAENTRGRQYANDWEGHIWLPAVTDSPSPIVISRHDTVMADFGSLPASCPRNAICSGRSRCTSGVKAAVPGLSGIGDNQQTHFTQLSKQEAF